MSNQYDRDLYPVPPVMQAAAIAKNQQQLPQKLPQKQKDQSQGFFASLLDEPAPEQPYQMRYPDGFSQFERARIAEDVRRRTAFQQKVKDLTEKAEQHMKNG